MKCFGSNRQVLEVYLLAVQKSRMIYPGKLDFEAGASVTSVVSEQLARVVPSEMISVCYGLQERKTNNIYISIFVRLKPLFFRTPGGRSIHFSI